MSRQRESEVRSRHRVRRRATTALAVLALSGGAGVAIADEASAAPPCIKISTWSNAIGWKYAKATNTCGRAFNIRMIWGNAIDGSCVTLEHDKSHTENRGPQASLTRIDEC